ncbi:MAG TPA: hypothetical protein VFP87_11630 [Chitinophagaceae bacterium]|nr:hypothetical protein [Chitinophagaceae bacterium]
MKPIFCLLFVVFAMYTRAQHQHTMPGMSDSAMKHMTGKKPTLKKTPAKKNMRMHVSGGHDAMKADTASPGVKMMDHKMSLDNMQDTMKHGMNMEQMNMSMSHSFSRNLPMNRDGSGTSWMPDASPMYMYMAMKNKSIFMLHGNIFLRYTRQDLFDKGSRGGHHFDAPNWFMGMYDKYIGEKGLFNATAMISLDPLLVTKRGYPLLFQSGESYKGKKLVDRQHPHDLFSALSIAYTQMLNRDVDVFVYFGYPGEPALGPPTFMHRISAMNDPDAPLGHHWQDATHISFGVGTLGVRYKNFKIEGSIFTGREPDENRYDFDRIKFDSYSYRLSFNPSKSWALQFSQGFVHSPELLEPTVNVTRTTASAVYSTWLNENNKYLAQSLVWGMNHSTDSYNENSALYEANVQLNRQAVYGRYEFVQKSAAELDLESEFGNTNFNINAFTLGYNRTIWNYPYVQLVAGAQATINFSPRALQDLYGKTPMGAEVYLQLKPNRHGHK